MRVAALTAYFIRNPLKHAIRHASHARTATENLVVCCRLNDGTEGWGEGLPRPYVTGETIETAREQLRATDLPAQLGGRFNTLDDLVGMLAELSLVGVAPNGRDCFGNAVRCAVELSLLDAATRAWGVPFSTVTSHVPELNGLLSHQSAVQYSMAITSASARKQALLALTTRLFGFRHCKVKVGVNGADDVTLLRRVRRYAGSQVDLRVDANEAWKCTELARQLEPLIEHRISCIEQPVPHAEAKGLAAIRRQIPLPIMLDESLCSLSDGRRAIEGGLCDLFNIRLSKCGGFVNSLRLAALAHQAGLGYQLGCQVGESGILSAAGRHFATSVAGIRYLEGSFDRHLVVSRLTRQDVTFGYGGHAPALTGPGLGIDVDREAVRRIAVCEEHWEW